MNIRQLWTDFRAIAGLERNTTSHTEKLISATGAFFGILVAYWVCTMTLNDPFGHTLIVASLGASAVLLFAVPHGALSQPWPVIGGHLVSALLGILCYKMIPDPLISAASATGAAVGAMYYLRCLHPPGGATALTAVIGGDEIHALGFNYALNPILINVLLIVLFAIVFNYLFNWRRYPAHLSKKHQPTRDTLPIEREYELTQEDFSAALQQLDSYLDITSESLTELLELAKLHAEKSITHPDEILPGRYYSNGKIGRLWSIRQIVDQSDVAEQYMTPPSKDLVIYKVVAGHGIYNTAVCLRHEFRQWARFEVQLENGRWVKVR